jgi:sigma-B regulation protein RsbU (phosphoserine phosphatase)
VELSWSVEEVARTSDDVVVRRRFDQRNFVWLVALVILFGIVSLFEIATNAHLRTPPDVAIGFANIILVAAMVLLLRDAHRASRAAQPQRGLWAAGNWVRAHLSATVISYIGVQYVLLLAFNRDKDGWYAWAVLMPLMLTAFRMIPAELLLMHGILIAASAVMLFVGAPSRGDLLPFTIIVACTHAVSAGVELFTSSRLRRSFLGEFNERRVQAREQLRMRDELRYARELQLSMLPDCAPQLDWLDICSISVPATEVGGDYYDYFVDDQRVALVCGDVAGHGMSAGLVLSALRSGFTLLRDSLGDPAAVLRRLHDLVAQTSRRRMLVTVAVVLLDRTTRRATVASAGHPPVIVRRADGRVETIDLFAPPLGVKLPVRIPQRELAFAPGDTFVLHSDGIYETRGAGGEAYGLERLAEVVRAHGEESAESLRDAITADVAAFRGAAEPGDDVTVVVARVV